MFFFFFFFLRCCSIILTTIISSTHFTNNDVSALQPELAPSLLTKPKDSLSLKVQNTPFYAFTVAIVRAIELTADAVRVAATPEVAAIIVTTMLEVTAVEVTTTLEVAAVPAELSVLDVTTFKVPLVTATTTAKLTIFSSSATTLDAPSSSTTFTSAFSSTLALASSSSSTHEFSLKIWLWRRRWRRTCKRVRQEGKIIWIIPAILVFVVQVFGFIAEVERGWLLLVCVYFAVHVSSKDRDTSISVRRSYNTSKRKQQMRCQHWQRWQLW
jgi:hypothetical protein